MTGVTIWLGFQYHVTGFYDFDRQAVLLTCLANLPLTLRRSAPVPVLLVSCLAAVWFFSEDYMPGFNIFGPLLMLYTLVASKPLRTAVIGGVLSTATIFVSGMTAGSYTVPAAAAQALMATAVACVFGAGARRLADQNERLLELTEQLHQGREERARTAVMEERVRIARELHDVVAHHMSVISVHVGLAQYVLPAGATTVHGALETIAVTSREAMSEMRRLLAVLRVATAQEQTDGGTDEPAPGLSRLNDLAERVRSAGVPVDVTVTGQVTELPSGADLCAYRVVQESLTNVLKHAGAARAAVVLDYQPGALVVRISDDGPGLTPRPIESPPAHGLLGMRERASLYGGTLSTGPGPDGGFAVTLALPVQDVT
ncbi:MAG TPA: sensor histidine kinase [Kineosporiaceae bacterium]|nr:sensor histidine kinase [Kineosporiaceae bacterium]